MTTETMIRKVLEDFEVKEVSDRVLEFVGSTEMVDRDGEVIRMNGWQLKNYRKNPVFMWAHDYHSPPIGRANLVHTDARGLMFQVEFADEETYPFADTIYKLYKGGFLKATSVGFIPLEWEDGKDDKAPRRIYKKQELLELSGVPVPANPEALVSARDQGCITAKEFDAFNQVIEVDDVRDMRDVKSATKPEETEDWISIPVAECEITATIDISEKEGIKALYCGKDKKVHTYKFDKREPFNWTMARAKKWVEEHTEGFEPEETKAAIPYKRTPLASEDTLWEASREVAQAEVADLKIMCTWVGDEPENKTAYKLPHHKAGGEHACVWAGVRATAAVIMGARGGVAIPDKDMPGVKAHIAGHYKDFDKGDPPWARADAVSQETIKDELDYLAEAISERGLAENTEPLAWKLVEIICAEAGSDIPVDIAAKVGAVLNAKNKQALKDAQGLIQTVLDSAAPEPQEESIDLKMTTEQLITYIREALAELSQPVPSKAEVLDLVRGIVQAEIAKHN